MDILRNYDNSLENLNLGTPQGKAFEVLRVISGLINITKNGRLRGSD